MIDIDRDRRASEEEELVDADDTRIGRAFRWSVYVALIAAAAVGIGLYLTSKPKEAPQVVEEARPTGPLAQRRPADIHPPTVRFAAVTQGAGIDFVHVNGAYGEKLLPETMGGGVAFLDYDEDGDPDLLLVNSDYWPGHAPAGAVRPTTALYRNEGGGKFTNVTAGSGLEVPCYGMGVAVGDYDNDGYVDVFISAVGANRLFHNEGGSGKFREVTARAGVGGDPHAWSTSSAFFDMDNDGLLDLFVANYVRWSRDIDLHNDFRLTGIGRAYGPPTTFEGSHPYLYHNNGDGTFSDVSARSGVRVTNPATGVPMAKSLSLTPVDIDNDGWLDLLVANDGIQNFLFHNQRDGTFKEIGVQLGLAFDSNGAATGAMGSDAAYFRNNRDLGFVIGNFANEMSSLYVSQGDPMQYADEAIVDGIGPATRRALTFGAFYFDYDLDGRVDLLQANGHLEADINKVQASQHYEQPAELFWNCGSDCPATFLEVPAAQTGDLATPAVGRGAAYADIDGDGDLDVIITQVGRSPLLLRNDQQLGHHWLRVRLVGTRSNRDAIGAQVELTSGGVTQRRVVMPTRSYLSQMELPVTFGLGKSEKIDSLKVHWPDGTTQSLDHAKPDTVMVVSQPQ